MKRQPVLLSGNKNQDMFSPIIVHHRDKPLDERNHQGLHRHNRKNQAHFLS